MIRPLVTAFRTLTIVPLPGKDANKLSDSLFFFPLAGAFIAICEYGIMLAGFRIVPSYPALVALAMAIAGVIITGAIHCDGLCDMCDGFFGGTTKERILAIMKDPRAGSFGVVALIFDLGTRVVGYSILVSHKAFFIVALSLGASRCMQAVAAAYMPYARENQGTASPFTGGTHARKLVAASCALTVAAGCLAGPWIASVILFACGLAITVIFLLWCRHKIGGITGDCIGACSEIVENAVLLAGIVMRT